MKKQVMVLVSLGILASAVPARADNLSNNFTANLNQNALDALTKDLGSLVGGGSFHQGKKLGFPLGVDVGVHVPIVKLDKDNVILRDDGSDANSGFVQAEVGLPLNLNVIGRIGQFEDADILGGGLRYGIFTPDVPGLPAISIEALYNKMEHDYFDMTTLSANLIASFDVPLIHPYVGVGWDSSELDPTDRAFVGAAAGTDTGMDSQEDGVRVEAGVNVSVIPFTYITLGGGLANSEAMYHVGAGVKF